MPTLTVICWLICQCGIVAGYAQIYTPVTKDTIIFPKALKYRSPLIPDTFPHRNSPLFKQPQTDTGNHKNGLFKKLGEYRDSLKNKEYRQSFIKRITKQDEPVPSNDIDSSIIKSEKYFTPFAGKVIRNIHYRKVKVFGPRNINDTSFTTSMKLIKLANRLHYDSRQWVIRQSLFFREDQRLDPFEMADNERYLRNRPFIQDARLYVKNVEGDSLDIEVVTKDLFEYGADLSQFSPTDIRASISNNNLFGAGQGVRVGARWRKDYNPIWNSEIRYTKYNMMGSFVDMAVGYTTLNNFAQLDTNAYEGSVYIELTRPLFRNAAKWVGGLTLAQNWSINIKGILPESGDSIFRDYRYRIIDGWVGYNLINNYRHDGTIGSKPNLAILARHYNLAFQRTPSQERYKDDPVYNNHRLYLLELQAYRIDYFKAHYFFGFGRTEDIPLGYNISATSGWETWRDRRRLYTGITAQKYWITHWQGLFNTTLELGNYWLNHKIEDAVFHARLEYYSRLVYVGTSRFRQFFNADYLNSPNPYFNKPLNINMEYGIWGYRDTKLNGYQRLNMESQTVYYSPLKILGFKFNFFADLQASILNHKHDDLLRNPVHLGIGGGFRVKNENLSLNTISVSGYYFPNPPTPVKGFRLEITTIVDFRFDVSALKAPSVILFR
ncbi:hypothetical protein [Chitinophaga terrae (ex Kim and Jung 2007)]|uniref:hypothetical protein n=1 Tax=Chitinophaga terrae (ex Kim and Jung 2007) TaxID=408074 RepID=UPI001113BF68|nr:hypothetical protein [Chitinophaga terrae (ex Kim and Jung 2007)]MDQ0106344.1 hypothetical protein [Chitinophaga terrae (ex Kim and Jung 2007)]